MIENMERRLRKTASHALPVSIGRRLKNAAIVVGLSESSDGSDCEGHAKHLSIVMVHLIAKTGFANLVQALELVQAQRITIRHYQAVEEDCQAFLAEDADALYFPQYFASLGNQQVLPVVRVHVDRQHAIDRTGKRAVQAIGQDSLEHHSLEHSIFPAPRSGELGILILLDPPG